jgi:hypothetical protein
VREERSFEDARALDYVVSGAEVRHRVATECWTDPEARDLEGVVLEFSDVSYDRSRHQGGLGHYLTRPSTPPAP